MRKTASPGGPKTQPLLRQPGSQDRTPDPRLCVPASRRVCSYRKGVFPRTLLVLRSL